MRYRTIYFSATVLSLLVCVCVLLTGSGTEEWEHQHLTALPKQECSHSGDVFCTHLPLISIDTRGQEVPGVTMEDKRLITTDVQIFDSETQNNHLTDTPTLTLQANIRYRGNTSRYFDKLSYLFRTVDENGEELDVSLLGMPEGHSWALNGPFLDKTLIRNYMCMNISAEVMGYAPRVRFFELYFNGEYQGVYLMMERVSRGDDRVPISKYNEGDPFTSYILRLDRGDEPVNALNPFSEYAMRRFPDTLTNRYDFNIEYPPKDLLTPEIVRYIEEDLSQIEKAIYSFDYDDDVYGYSNLLDVDSFVDYFILNEFFQNSDAMLYSTYFYKDLRSTLSVGPVWDWNNACDNYMEEIHDGTGFRMTGWYMYFMLMRDENFVEQIIARYRFLRQNVLSEEYLMNYIDSTVAYLGDAVDRNYEVWGYSFDPDQLTEGQYLEPKSRNPSNYEEAIQQLKNFLIARGNWLDQYIENLRQFSHESKNKKFNH